MGMFDSIFDADGNEWQTKAFGCCLAEWKVGDRPEPESAHPTYQVEVLGGADATLEDGYATIRDGAIVAVPSKRDASLPLIDYYGGTIEMPNPEGSVGV